METEKFYELIQEAITTIGDDAIPIIENHLHIHFENTIFCLE